VVLSEKWRAYIAAAEPQARVVIIHNFVDLPRLHAAIERIAVKRADNVILFLGEIGQRKGIYDLVRAMPGIVALCPDARLIAGGSGELEQVADCARSVGMEHAVSLPGWVAGEDKMRLLANAAVYVLPSHNENFPVSILEAMAAGLPVVSTPVGGIPDMIRNGQEGYLVEPGDTAKLAEAIGGLLAQPTRRLQMGESAQRRLRERFSADDAIAAFSALYGESGAFVHDVRKTAVREA
jgi:glycosyltransferase involved in cell wall biosynthesis